MQYGQTPLHLAAERGHLAIQALLRERGALSDSDAALFPVASTEVGPTLANGEGAESEANVPIAKD